MGCAETLIGRSKSQDESLEVLLHLIQCSKCLFRVAQICGKASSMLKDEMRVLNLAIEEQKSRHAKPYQIFLGHSKSSRSNFLVAHFFFFFSLPKSLDLRAM